MPFHIGYSGPAPISTYFRVKDAPPPEYLGKMSINASEMSTRPPSPSRETPLTSDSQQTLVASSSRSISIADDVSVMTLTEDVEMKTVDTPISCGKQHLVAAFRGRTVHGLTVVLPEGYAGIVLDAPKDAKGKSPEVVAEEGGKEKARKAPARKQSTRRATRSTEADDDDEDSGADDLAHIMEESSSIRSLQPTSIFSSFVLWQADNPVDEGRDEYLRAISEWTKLAAVVRLFALFLKLPLTFGLY
ncbi:hypothetical protein NM688_g690 [Phlebia brevispora]|uniref:Uncharacterized protein n=1 Tax=Phlebia brevispora TaxID=194682 RepID=A0ACC1TDM6_9APHY|nr:hypothetical protein NM688_g690 [Phlebia brevispora]